MSRLHLTWLWLLVTCLSCAYATTASPSPSRKTGSKDKVDDNVIFIILALVGLFVFTLAVIAFVSWKQTRTPPRRRQPVTVVVANQNRQGTQRRHESTSDVQGAQVSRYENTSVNHYENTSTNHYENPGMMNTALVDSSWWEIPMKKLKIHSGVTLGSGQFGVILLASVSKNDEEKKCAVKTVREDATEDEKRSLRSELLNMSKMDPHPNIVNLIGAVTSRGNIMVVLEYCENGDLLTYLRKNRSDMSWIGQPDCGTTIEYDVRVRMAIDIANGMSYLASKGFIHRDLAARNVLLDGSLKAKVSDFGRTRDIGETFKIFESLRGRNEPVPTRWMPPETLRHQIFTSQSDVWSFGVLLWEIESGGIRPYDKDKTYREVMDKIVYQGQRLEQPSYCPNAMYEIMVSCWNIDPLQRPTFDQLGISLSDLLKQPASLPKYSTLPK